MNIASVITDTYCSIILSTYAIKFGIKSLWINNEGIESGNCTALVNSSLRNRPMSFAVTNVIKIALIISKFQSSCVKRSNSKSTLCDGHI